MKQVKFLDTQNEYYCKYCYALSKYLTPNKNYPSEYNCLLCCKSLVQAVLTPKKMEEIKDFNEFKKKSFNYATYKNKKIYEKIYKGMSKSEIHLYIASNYREYKCYEKFIIIPAIVMVAVLYIGFLILVNQ